MRFCMVTTFYPPFHFGGDAIYVRTLARHLVRRGHEVEVVHCEDAYRLKGVRAVAPQVDPGIRTHRLRSRWGPLSSLITQQTGVPGLKKRQIEAIFRRRFDVVNFHNISLVGGPGVLSLSTAPINLYTLHEHWLVCPTHFFWKNKERPCDRPHCFRCCLRSGLPPQAWRSTGFIQRALRHVDTLICLSEYSARRHREGGITGPMRLLPQLVDLETRSDAPRRIPGRPSFLFVGRVTASKGVVHLLREFSRRPAYDLHLIGDGDLRAPLEKRYAHLPHIHFHGPVHHRELAVHYRRATALVLPSLAPEVCPLTVLESFSCGMPVIVRDAGGNRELVDKTGAGFIYEDDASLLEMVDQLAGDPKLCAGLGERALAGYEKHYSPESVVDAYLDLIAALRKEKAEAAPA